MTETYFDPVKFLDDKKEEDTKPIVLLILNQPIQDVKMKDGRSLFESLWNYSRLRVCADGGANQLFDFLKTEKMRLEKVSKLSIDLVAPKFASDLVFID